VANDGWLEGVHVKRMRTLPEVTSARGDFAEFFSREYARLARACLLLTGNTAEAEDLTQDALARVYARWHEVGSMDSPEGYLFRTALNLNRQGSGGSRSGPVTSEIRTGAGTSSM